jgi:uncharacterized Zn-finger protein
MAEANAKTASNRVFYQVKRKDLPLSCPAPDAETWSLHPRVYLPIKKTGKAVCPYCGARYELVD